MFLYLSLWSRGEVLTDGIDVLDVLIPFGISLLGNWQSRRGLRRTRERGTRCGGKRRLRPRHCRFPDRRRGRRDVCIFGDGRWRRRKVVETRVHLRILVPAAVRVRIGRVLRRRRLNKRVLRQINAREMVWRRFPLPVKIRVRGQRRRRTRIVQGATVVAATARQPADDPGSIRR